MKARLYVARGEEKNYVDGYSLYLPYSKSFREWQTLGYRLKGCYLGCSPASDGTMVRCSWAELEGPVSDLGKRVKIEDMPQPFQRECRRIEALFNEALKTGTWVRFNREA